MKTGEKINLKVPSFGDLNAFFIRQNFPAYRSKQLIHWIYNKKANRLDQLTNFAKKERQYLEDNSYIGDLETVGESRSADGTFKFLFKLEDGERIESVLIPDGGRQTLCVSTQAGCGLGCQFCLTATGGLRRNLRAHEIVDQFISVSRRYPVTNIVMMGMGEPLANFQEVEEAIIRLTDSSACSFSPRRITVSTAGMAPGIIKLGELQAKVNLAVSLNATTNEIRDRIMPINKTYPLETLLAACRTYPLSPRRKIFFEYVLLDGINNSPADARRMIKLLTGIPCKINLIPFNEFPGSGFKRPANQANLAFQKILLDARMTAFIRKTRGNDVLAACGQLVHPKNEHSQ